MKTFKAETELWEYLARQWARRIRTWKRGDGIRYLGICYQLDCYANKFHNGFVTIPYAECRCTLRVYAEATGDENSCFWPLTKAGARQREAFCREHAGLPKKRGKQP